MYHFLTQCASSITKAASLLEYGCCRSICLHLRFEISASGNGVDGQQQCTASLAAPAPSLAEEGSGALPLLELFFPPEILGNMNMQILRLSCAHGMQV